jgi:uncharacterized Tic20 family protein
MFTQSQSCKQCTCVQGEHSNLQKGGTLWIMVLFVCVLFVKTSNLVVTCSKSFFNSLSFVNTFICVSNMFSMHDICV